MNPSKILGNPEEKKRIEELLEKAGKDRVIDSVVSGREDTSPRMLGLGGIVGLKEITKQDMQNSGDIYDVAFSPDNKWLAVGQWPAYLLKFDGKRLEDELAIKLLGKETYSVAFSKCGRYIATGGKKDGSPPYEIKIYALERMYIKGRSNSAIPVKKVRFSPDGKYVAAIRGGAGENIPRLTIYKFEKKNEKLQNIHTEYNITDFEFYPDGKSIAAIWNQHGLFSLGVYRFSNKGILTPSSETRISPVSKLLLSPNGKYFVLASEDKSTSKNELIVLNEPSLKYVFLSGENYDSKIDDIAHDPGSECVVVASGDNLGLFDYRIISLSGHDPKVDDINRSFQNYQVKKLRFSPDGKYLAAACSDKFVRIMEVVRKEK